MVALASRGPAQVTVQRHNSYEHALMGDAGPKDVERVVAGLTDKAHAVGDEYQRIIFFKTNPQQDPRDRFPSVRWIQLGTSRLWLSSGEMSALADYLPNPDTIDKMSEHDLTPVLQRMRQDIAGALSPFLKPGSDPGGFSRAAPTPEWTKPLPGSVQQVEANNAATEELGNMRQKGLLSRNACHFPPFSWERWSLFHNEARKEAAEWYRIGQGASGTPGGTNAHERKAWENNAYSKHFLQDSFAAGHLINKTLVMQWFLEYNRSKPWASGVWAGLPRDDVMQHMDTTSQPGISGRDLYTNHGGPRLHVTASDDRAAGTTAADPQTTEERQQGMGRLSGSGVRQWNGRGRALAYAEYSEFLNSSYLNLAANDAHDVLNAIGLTVRNGNNVDFRVGGDATLLSKSNEIGLRVVLEANQLADKAIDDIVRTGTTAVTVESIFQYFPVAVFVEGHSDPVPLETWNLTFLKDLCFKKIFPHVQRAQYAPVRWWFPRLLEGSTPMDLPVAKP